MSENNDPKPENSQEKDPQPAPRNPPPTTGEREMITDSDNGPDRRKALNEGNDG